jgi:hypothetical protein
VKIVIAKERSDCGNLVNDGLFWCEIATPCFAGFAMTPFQLKITTSAGASS